MTTKYPPYVVTDEKTLASFGDTNYLKYGGQLLLQGPYDPEKGEGPSSNQWIEVIEEPCQDIELSDPNARWAIYRFEPEQMQTVQDPEDPSRTYVVSGRYKPDWPYPVRSYVEWFTEPSKLLAVCETMGLGYNELVNGLCSDDIKDRAAAYVIIAQYHGYHEFDSYPLALTAHEAYARYAASDDCPCSKCNPEIED